MSSQIIQLKAGDFDEAMGFLNEVFGEHAPHDFAHMLPSIYQPTDEHMRCNYAVRDRGRLAAIVGVFPIDWRVGGIALKMAGVGGVSVHKDFRGKGYMKLLMNHAVDEMRREGIDISYLGGRRQRYAYFGYEVGGGDYRLSFNKDNVRHTFADRDDQVVLEPAHDDTSTNMQIKQMLDACDLHCDRPVETIHRYLKSWFAEPMLARSRDGTIVGYISSHPENRQINELAASDPDTTAQIIRQWVIGSDKNVTLRMLGPVGSILHRLVGFAENVTIGPTGNWRVFNWVKLVDALLKVQHAASPLLPGTVVVGVDDEDLRLCLTVDEQGARCESCGEPADISADALTVTRLLFGPLSPSAVMPIQKRATILSTWCPLPLGISPQDKV